MISEKILDLKALCKPLWVVCCGVEGHLVAVEGRNPELEFS